MTLVWPCSLSAVRPYPGVIWAPLNCWWGDDCVLDSLRYLNIWSLHGHTLLSSGRRTRGLRRPRRWILTDTTVQKSYQTFLMVKQCGLHLVLLQDLSKEQLSHPSLSNLARTMWGRMQDYFRGTESTSIPFPIIPLVQNNLRTPPLLNLKGLWLVCRLELLFIPLLGTVTIQVKGGDVTLAVYEYWVVSLYHVIIVY